MAAPIPNMAAITTSLERSLQNCSLNHHHHHHPRSSSGSTTGSVEAAHGLDSPPNLPASPVLELNSEASLPFHWEQCLDLKTGEIYYINWRTGMKAKEDPRRIEDEDRYYSDEDSSSSYAGSSSESSPSTLDKNEERCSEEENEYHVLVVAGCKSCLMYYMVPKQLQICPKCCAHLLHFGPSENGSS